MRLLVDVPREIALARITQLIVALVSYHSADVQG